MADVFKDNDRQGNRHKMMTPDELKRYREFRNELQREIFVSKNYDISIVALEKKHGIYKGR